MNPKIPVAAVVGPTASGKTALGIDIARSENGEIVSADSMQIYRGIHIASAAPDSGETGGIPHHLIEFLEPSEKFTVADYVSAAKNAVKDIYSRGKLPIVVGGTGLYIDSLLDGISFTDEEENSGVRARLIKQSELYGSAAMLEKLREIDPAAAERLHPNDLRRILRAIEVYELTGKTFSECLSDSRSESAPFNSIIIGITFKNRDILYDRINRRVDKMLENGLEPEAREAFAKSHGGAAQAIGHKELFAYFKGGKSLEEAAEDLKRATRRYAKRQLTWFRRNENINWIYADECENVSSEAIRIIKEWKKSFER